MKNLNLKIYKLSNIFVICYLLFVIVIPAGVSASAVKSVSNSGLVGYWPLNDGAGSKANDMSGNRNIGTLTGSPTWVAGRVGKALSFAGGMYVSVPSNDVLTIQGNFTLSVWIKTSNTGTGGTSNYRDIISKVPSGSPWPGYVMAINGNGAISVWTASNVAGAWSDDSGYNLADGKWHLVSVSLSGTTAQIYVDGVAKGSFTKAIPGSNNNGIFSLGAEVGTTASRDFIGSIDDVHIYNRALSSSEIKTIYQFGSAQNKVVSNSGLVGYWSLNDGAGSKANDMSGSGNNGTLIHSPTWENGKLGKALLLNNSNSYVSVPSVQALKYTGGGMTLETWIYPNIGETAATFISKPWNGSGVYNYYLTYGPVITFYVRGATACSINSGANTAPQGSWHHIVATIAIDGTMNLYIDGALVGSGACGIVDWTPSLGDLSLPLSIGTLYPYGAGAWDQPTHAFGGKMDNVRVYSRVLSASEVQQAYKQNATQVNSSKNDFLTSGLVGLWSFDGKDMNWGANKVLDRSGQGNDGTLFGMSTTSSPTNGKLGQALKFRGVSSGTYVNLGTSATLTPVNFAVSAWVNAGSGTYTGGYGYVYSNARDCCTAGQNGINVFFTSGILYAVIWNGGSAASVNSPVAVAQNSGWHHIVATYNGATLAVYVDGVLKNSASTALGVGTPATYTTNIGSMGYAPGVYTFDGKIDDVRLYNRAITATEVKQLYNLAR